MALQAQGPMEGGKGILRPASKSSEAMKCSKTLGKAMAKLVLNPIKKKKGVKEWDEESCDDTVESSRSLRSKDRSLSRGRSRSRSRGRSEELRSCMVKGRRGRSRSRGRSPFSRNLSVRFAKTDHVQEVEPIDDYDFWWTSKELSDSRKAARDLLKNDDVHQYLESYQEAQDQVRKATRISGGTWTKFLSLQESRGMEVLDVTEQVRRKRFAKKVVTSTVATYQALRRTVVKENDDPQKGSLLDQLKQDIDMTATGKLPILRPDEVDAVSQALREHVLNLTAACRRWAVALGKADMMALQNQKAPLVRKTSAKEFLERVVQPLDSSSNHSTR